MILTGKSKEDFVQWLKSNYPIGGSVLEVGIIRPSFLHALIIEWLDMVGIYVNTMKEEIGYSCGIYQEESMSNILYLPFDSRQEATKAAIEKANELYNEKP